MSKRQTFFQTVSKRQTDDDSKAKLVSLKDIYHKISSWHSVDETANVL